MIGLLERFSVLGRAAPARPGDGRRAGSRRPRRYGQPRGPFPSVARASGPFRGGARPLAVRRSAGRVHPAGLAEPGHRRRSHGRHRRGRRAGRAEHARSGRTQRPRRRAGGQCGQQPYPGLSGLSPPHPGRVRTPHRPAVHGKAAQGPGRIPPGLAARRAGPGRRGPRVHHARFRPPRPRASAPHSFWGRAASFWPVTAASSPPTAR